MISNVEEYEFVIGADIDDEHPHGDLDRIIIDGEIMPKRTGDTENTDADGEPIPRANILRGEDVAFLMEAVMQRTERHWFVADTTYQWERSADAKYWEKIGTRWASKGFETLTFSRKISADNFERLAYYLDGVCDKALNDLSVGKKVFDSSDQPWTFEEAYGFSGLPSFLRTYKKLAKPKCGKPLSKDYLLSLFATLALCRYGLLGYVSKSNPENKVNINGDTGGYPTDFIVVATSGEGTATNTYMRWGVYTDKWNTWEDAGDGNLKPVWHSGTSYCVPKSSHHFVLVETRHVKNATAVVLLNIQFLQNKGTDPDNLSKASVTAWDKTVWLPVSMKAYGSGVFGIESEGTFDSTDSLLSILSDCGWQPPTVPSGELYFEERVMIYISYVYILGEWDDHTSLDA